MQIKKKQKLCGVKVSLTSRWRRMEAVVRFGGGLVEEKREAARRWKLNRTATGQVSKNYS